MELLVNYYLSKGEWVKATDAFHVIWKNSQEEIKSNPEGFFFPLHTILMQNREAADAGKLLKLAERYNLPEKLMQIMQSDCLLALGFYDQAAQMFSEMQRGNENQIICNDRILDYDLAVCEFFLLNFESAAEHLQKYKEYFTDSLDSVEKTENLQKQIDCFLLQKPLKKKAERHAFDGLIWSKKIEETLQAAVNKWLYLSIDALYQLETAEKWDMLRPVKEVIICPLTVSRIMELYQQTGDIVFYRLIMHIKEQENVKIESPKLDYYLAVDEEMPGLLMHYKMERALFLQKEVEKTERE